VAGAEELEFEIDLDARSERPFPDVGRYRIIAELARGGMGIVYLALLRGPAGFSKLFVVKILKDHLSEDPKLVEMFLDEARLTAKLNHTNIVQTIEVGTDASRHFIAMEFLDGQSHSAVLARARRSGVAMPIRHNLYLLTQVLEGLQYAHGGTDFDGAPLDLVHRDVSPHNVLVTYDGQVKILDFGIAKALGATSETRTGVLKGKVAYMAPEQSVGERIDRRADIFAVGAMLWEVAVGARMWPRTLNDLQILHALMNGAIPRPRDALPDVDERLERIIVKATAPRAADRYSTAREMQEDIETYVREANLAPLGPRELGQFVSELFAEERARLRSTIDSQLRILRAAYAGAGDGVDQTRQSSLSGATVTPSPQLRSAPRRERPRRALAVGATVAGLFLIGGVATLGLRHGGTGTPTGIAATMGPSGSAVSAPPALASSAPAIVAAPTVAAAASASPGSAAVPPSLPRGVGRASPPPAPPPPPPLKGNMAPQATSPAVTPEATPAPAPPAATSTPSPEPTSTSHVRQQIDTANPYRN
jgi:serine/threonine protein kinase